MESTTGSTAGGSVVARPGDHCGHARGRVRLLIVALVLSLVFVYEASTRELPYYAIAPGSAVDTGSLVKTDDAHMHPPQGKVLLTTVSLGKVTLLKALEGWLDPAVDVVKERAITGPEDIDEDELRQINLDLMEASKQQALGVAFEQLGVDAISGAGAEVVAVLEGMPAAGVLSVGDTIIAVDGAPVAVDYEAVRALGRRVPGDRVRLRVVAEAGGARRDVEVVLTEHPDELARAFLGVSLTTKDLRFDFPFDVEVSSERIGGPSAGLAFTLEIIDVLTPGELTGGTTVAATGTIELDGSVGEVGGVAQKTIAVRRAGADLFLVPTAELEVAQRFAGDDLRVEPVENLDQALSALATVGGNGLALPDLATSEARA